MMEIYLVRHTAPDVAKGVCYGQADIDVTDSFITDAVIIRKHLPVDIRAVYSSPLQRCTKLASHLFPGHSIQLEDDLKEINCGEWELQRWDDLPREEVTPWFNDRINKRMPGGESYQDVFERVAKLFHRISQQSLPAVIVAHGGVIRSILAFVTNTSLQDAFKIFSSSYGCVIKLINHHDGFQHEVLSNIPQEKETHKPSYL